MKCITELKDNKVLAKLVEAKLGLLEEVEKAIEKDEQERKDKDERENITKKLKEVIPRQNFEVALQAAIGACFLGFAREKQEYVR